MSKKEPRFAGAAVAAFVLAAALVLAPAAEASKTARVVSLSAGGAALWHAGISLAVPNPVTPVTSFIYGCIGFGAGIYDAVVDPAPNEPPQILRVVTGPASDRDPESGELVAGGETVSAAPVSRVVSLIGTGFSWEPNEMSVTFDGVAAALAPLSTNTLASVVVPPLAGPLPRTVELKITVQGIESLPVTFTVGPRVAVVDDGLALRTVGRLRLLTELVRDYDWAAQLQAENPDLSDAEQADAMQGADDMVSCSEQALEQLSAYEDEILADPSFSRANNQLLTASPELGELIEDAITRLETGAVAVDPVRAQAQAPSP